VEILSSAASPTDYRALKPEDRIAILEILRDTKPDFPAS